MQSERAAPIGSSLRFRSEAGVLPSCSSCKIALFPLSPPGTKAKRRSSPQRILAGELGEVRRAGGVAASPWLVWPVPNFPQPLSVPQQRVLGGVRLSSSRGRSRAMPGFLRRPGQLLAVAMLVLQPAGSLGECRSPARFLRFWLSALLAGQTRNKQ